MPPHYFKNVYLWFNNIIEQFPIKTGSLLPDSFELNIHLKYRRIFTSSNIFIKTSMTHLLIQETIHIQLRLNQASFNI